MKGLVLFSGMAASALVVLPMVPANPPLVWLAFYAFLLGFRTPGDLDRRIF